MIESQEISFQIEWHPEKQQLLIVYDWKMQMKTAPSLLYLVFLTIQKITYILS